MNQSTFAAVGFALCFGAACSGNSDEHAPPIAMADGGASQGGSAGTHVSGGSGSGGGSGGHDVASGGVVNDAGAAGSLGDAGTLNDGGAAGMQEGMIIPVPASSCSESAVWAMPKPLAVAATGASERLLSITADELDLVFERGGKLYRAHRSAASDVFGSAAAVTVPVGYGLSAGAALSADAKTLILVASSGQGFGALTRASRTVAFGAVVNTAPFLALNQRAEQTMEQYAAPVLAPNGNSLVFTAFTPEPAGGFPVGVVGRSVVYESVWSTGSWAMPSAISHNLFDGTTLKRPLPSGLSSDSRTLFYFDEGTSKEVARFRDRPDAPLYTVVDLGARAGAVPNAACNVLYYSSSGDVLFDTK